MKDICYRDAPGSIVTIKEQEKFKEYKKCEDCGETPQFIMGLIFGAIGTTILAICPKCNWKKNITDYDCW